MPKIFNEGALKKDQIGTVTGLAWTAVGGDILFIEAIKTKGKGKLMLTGQLGEVMEESAQAAFSYAKARSKELGIDEEVLENFDIHVHLPEGAIPKDGPAPVSRWPRRWSRSFSAAGPKRCCDDGRDHFKGQRASDRGSQRKAARGAACEDKNESFYRTQTSAIWKIFLRKFGTI